MLGTALTASQGLDCKTVGFFLKIGKAWRKSLTRAKRASLARLAPDLLFDCSRVPEYAKTLTVLQPIRQTLSLFCGVVPPERLP